ncbi:MAG: M23 family metallopeptidase [Bacteroidota bacterium]
MAEKKREKRKSGLKKLLVKYRLVLINDGTYEEVGYIRLSRLNVISVGGGLSLLLLAAVYSLIAYTPIRETIPGYPDAVMTQTIRENAMRIDSLRNELAIRDQYFENLNSIISGKEPQSYLDDAGSAQVSRDDIVFLHSANDSLLRQQVEAEEQFRLSVAEVPAKRGDLHDLHFFTPVSGMITNPFNPLESHFGVDLVTAPNEVVKATLDGTVTMATWTLETGYVIQIQHENNLVSVYKHNAELFKSPGMKVRAGDAIAIVGNSGELTTGPHLHFELWNNGSPLNPADYIVF